MGEIIYLDNAATTFPKPDHVHEYMGSFYRRCGVSPGRTGCDMALEAEGMIHVARKRLTALVHPSATAAGEDRDPNRLVFTSNASHSLNLVIQGVLKPGDHVVTSAVEHNSVLRPLNHMVRRGVRLSVVRPDAEGYLDPDDVRRALAPDTRLVILNHGSNVIGTVQDIDAIGAVCREAGVLFALDAAQTAGVVPIDMDRCGLQYVAMTGHKGLFGPTGTGALYVAEGAPIESVMWGGTGVRSADPYHLTEFPYRLEAGTHNVLGIAGLSAGVEWVQKETLEHIARHELELLGLFQEEIAGVRGVHVHGTTRLDRRLAVCSLTVDGFDAADVGTILDVDYNILTRTGLQCAPLIHEHMGTAPRGTVRFSFGPFNTVEHARTAARAVREIAADRN
ncbi:MAG: aminotransferase class V-fold PLP-dependent enzyme [Acidobacteria bacterium]|nr:aminotransferase class V-fold PLP-dependent enzyme [Acidobacteriota bacterium]